MNKFPLFSIIIPLYKKTPYFYETVGRCLELDYPNFEILIGVDGKTEVSYQDKRIKILRTGARRTGPAEKRDIAIRMAKGKYIAFLDDDSYPKQDWLKKSYDILQSNGLQAVCGPGLTPPLDSFSQKITGALLASKLGSGPYYYRFTRGSNRYVDDYPAYNMIVATKALRKVGGFGTKYYGGEDTAVCIKLVNSGVKILYHPEIVVYHHRRKFPFEYAKQVGNVGLHRGYFVKKYPQTSLRPSYFGPALAVVVVIVLFFMAFFSFRIFLYISLMGLVFYLIVFIDAMRREGLLISILLPFAAAVNYLSYGLYFLKGLLLTDELSR